jgi:hypothetical protein
MLSCRGESVSEIRRCESEQRVGQRQKELDSIGQHYWKSEREGEELSKVRRESVWARSHRKSQNSDPSVARQDIRFAYIALKCPQIQGAVSMRTCCAW